MAHLLLADGNNLCHRSYWATVHAGMQTEGVATGGVYGAIQSLRSYMREIRPTHVIWCFDKGKSEYRTALRPEYKGHRKYAAVKAPAKANPEKDIPEQIDMFRTFLTACGIKHVSQSGVEADDLIATAVKRWGAMMDTTIITSDHDLLQLVGDRVRVLRPGEKKATSTTGIKALMGRSQVSGRMYSTSDVVEKYGVSPRQLPEVWALVGDKGDNIEGIPGVGPKTAAKWVTQHGNLAQVLRHEVKTRGYERRVAENYSLILLDGKIGQLSGHVHQFFVNNPTDPRLALQQLKRWGMASLVDSIMKEGLW